jgi:hypothetical protein
MTLAAQRGHSDPPRILEPESGVTGRVMRSRQPAYIRDVGRDPDHVAGNEASTSEICVPLLARGELLGLLNVESTRSGRLDRADLATVTLVADRLASAIALGARHDGCRGPTRCGSRTRSGPSSDGRPSGSRTGPSCASRCPPGARRSGSGMESSSDLISVADVGLQVAKRAGGDQVVAA